MLQSILVATDFRPASQAAAQVAVLLSSAFSSRVTVFHALEQTWPTSSQENQDLLLKYLADQKVDVTNLLIGMGPPADTIVQKANEIDADLILIGAGEVSRHDRFSIGPVATAVIEHAPQPVLAVRPGEPALRFQKILCPVDQSGASGRGLRNAIRLARAFGGELVILTVVPEVSWLTAAVETGQLAGVKAEYERKWRDEFDRFLAGIPTHEVKANNVVRHGKPHEQIVAAAQEHQADVIIMGATGRTGLVRVLLGSTTRRLLEQLPCSLLVVKEEDVVEELFEGEVRLIQQLLTEGRKLLSSGVHDAALAKFRQVLAHNPFHVGAITSLAEAHEKLGHHDQARYYRRRAENLQEKS
jgi:nucleotide-binding universal stress UspA family protein